MALEYEYYVDETTKELKKRKKKKLEEASTPSPTTPPSTTGGVGNAIGAIRKRRDYIESLFKK